MIKSSELTSLLAQRTLHLCSASVVFAKTKSFLGGDGGARFKVNGNDLPIPWACAWGMGLLASHLVRFKATEMYQTSNCSSKRALFTKLDIDIELDTKINRKSIRY